MSCVDPRTIWQVNGKWTHSEPLSPSLYPVKQHSCGQCAGCRLGSQANWTTRLQQHAQSVPGSSCCATLTYSPEHLPEFGSLRAAHYSNAIKALRQIVDARGGDKFSADGYGEYSPPPACRPHIHIGLFNYYPPDAVKYGRSQAGNMEYTSAELDRAWGHKGLVTFQPWSAGAAAYCAGHQSWKLSGALARQQLQVIVDGIVIAEREPEFHRCSKRPGIGRPFVDKYGQQALANGFTVIDGRKVPLPDYYLRRLALTHPEAVELARAERQAIALAAAVGNDTPQRLDTIEACNLARMHRQARTFG